MLAFPSAPPHIHAHLLQDLLEQAKVNRLFPRQNSTLLIFFQNPQNPPRTPPVHDITHTPKSYLGFLFWHLWTTHPPHTRANTCAQACTQPTHVQSWKVLSLTKPKGKIYKTKSLGHYIAVEQTELFSLSLVTSLGKQKTDFKPAVLYLKTNIVLHPAHSRGVG